MAWNEDKYPSLLSSMSGVCYQAWDRTCCSPPLQSIPVNGPFHTVGVDIVQLPLTQAGNKYAVIFIDYLTKWVEVFAVAEQSAETVA